MATGFTAEQQLLKKYLSYGQKQIYCYRVFLVPIEWVQREPHVKRGTKYLALQFIVKMWR
jgi:hypothetical protein